MIISDISNYNLVLDKLSNSVKDSKLVCIPSDTSYGLSGLAFDTKAESGLHELKGQDPNKPLSIMFAEKSDILNLFKPNKLVEILVEEYLPGPLTIIAETKSGQMVGARLPDHNLSRDLIKKLKAPIFTSSANLHGLPACYSIEELENQLGDDFKKIDSVLDLGVLDFKLASTVVRANLDSLEILREGQLALEIRQRLALQ